MNNTGGDRDWHLRSSQSVVDGTTADSFKALKELVDFGFIRDFAKGCFACGSPLSDAETYKAPGKLYFRCTSWKCEKGHNVTDFSLFRGTRFSLVDLCRVITFYSRSRLMDAPRVADAQSQLKLARKGAQHIYESLQSAEARAGEKLVTTQRKNRKLVGDAEADRHGVRKLYVGQKNPVFKKKWLKLKNVSRQIAFRKSCQSIGKHAFESLD